jgi:hypothetical protein
MVYIVSSRTARAPWRERDPTKKERETRVGRERNREERKKKM